MAKRGVGSSSCHGGTLLMGVKRRVRGRNVGGVMVRRRESGQVGPPMRATMEIHSRKE